MISLNPAKLNRCDWFIIVWVVYYLQGVLYSSGGAFSILLLGINLMVSIGCAIKIWQRPHNPQYIKGLNFLVLIFSIYGFALILMNPGNTGLMLHWSGNSMRNNMPGSAMKRLVW